MKKNFFATALLGLTLSSCCTVFTSSKQSVTFMAPDGTRIFDAGTNVKIAEVKQDNTVTVSIRKSRENKQLIARKDGYRPAPFVLETGFNAATLWNFLFWPGFLVDLGTAQMFKWENTLVSIEMESAEDTDNCPHQSATR